MGKPGRRRTPEVTKWGIHNLIVPEDEQAAVRVKGDQ